MLCSWCDKEITDSPFVTKEWPDEQEKYHSRCFVAAHRGLLIGIPDEYLRVHIPEQIMKETYPVYTGQIVTYRSQRFVDTWGWEDMDAIYPESLNEAIDRGKYLKTNYTGQNLRVIEVTKKIVWQSKEVTT